MTAAAREISPEETARWIDAGEPLLILDCRLPEEHETARLQGSVLVPMHEVEERLDEIEDALEERGMERDAPIAVLCHHGVRSLRAALMLQALGFPGARSIRGGIEAWSTEVDPSVPRYVREGSRCTVV